MRISYNTPLIFVGLLVCCLLSCKTKKKVEEYELSIVVVEPITGNNIPKDMASLCLPFEYGDSLIIHSNKETTSPILKKVGNEATQSIYIDASSYLGNFFGAGTKKLKSKIEKGLSGMPLNTEFGKRSGSNEELKVKFDSVIVAVKERNDFTLILGKKPPVQFYQDIRILSTMDSVRIVLAQTLTNPAIRNVTVFYGVEASFLSKSTSTVNKPILDKPVTKNTKTTQSVIPPKIIVPPKPKSQPYKSRNNKQPTASIKNPPTQPHTKADDKSELDKAVGPQKGVIKKGDLDSKNTGNSKND